MTSSLRRDSTERPHLLDLYCCQGGAAMGYTGWADGNGAPDRPEDQR